ncbi:MAG: ABC transporter ATP-binding protein [Nocardioides sp.]
MSAVPTAAPLLEVRDLGVRYGSVTAVDAVSLTGAAREVIGLLGPNGAGKTSVIRALTTIVRPVAGDVVVAGHRLADAPAVRAAIGVLPESNGYPGGVTAVAFLRYHGQLFGLSRAEAAGRAEALLERVGLAGERRPIAAFSRGMRQRLGLARALVNRPAVLFLDEPTLGLDPAGQESILGHLAATAEQDGACVVLCSHLLDEVERICHRVVILDHGRVIVQGSVSEVVAAAGTTRLSDAFLSLTGSAGGRP